MIDIQTAPPTNELEDWTDETAENGTAYETVERGTVLGTVEEIAEETVDESLLANSPFIEELSSSHVGTWNKLVSQTNWEKGMVILRWRNAMIAAEMPRAAYSDDAWARRVGNVSPQHVGRLRRVSERFGEAVSQYSNLFWSHFQAALDWEDAEMWLEGAVQNDWSVTQMKVQRWEAIGAPENLKPQENEIFTAEIDEDVNPRNDSSYAAPADRTQARTMEIGAADIVDGFSDDTPPFDVADEPEKKKSKKEKEKAVVDGPSTGELLASLKDTSDLPSDLSEPLETLKIAILNHKLAGWQDVPVQKVLRFLDALKAVVVSTED